MVLVSAKVFEKLSKKTIKVPRMNLYSNKIARMYEGEGEFKNALNYYQKSMRLESEVQAQRNKEQSLHGTTK